MNCKTLYEKELKVVKTKLGSKVNIYLE
jgi:hypothetical protein